MIPRRQHRPDAGLIRADESHRSRPSTRSVRPTLPVLAPVLVALAIFVAGTTAMNWVKYVSLRSTYAYDLGFFHNVAFNQALGRDTFYLFAASWFSPGDHDGPSVFRSNHFSPMRGSFPTRTLMLPSARPKIAENRSAKF